MEIENKYYTPKIEDLFVGYECQTAEVNWDLIPESYWYPICITEKDLKESRPRSFGHNDTYSIWSFPIRTPFLTKEQIEQEGWENRKNIFFHTGQYGLYGVKIENFKNNPEKIFKIRIVDLYLMEQLFYGMCSSINEFRKICKLLNID